MSIYSGLAHDSVTLDSTVTAQIVKLCRLIWAIVYIATLAHIFELHHRKLHHLRHIQDLMWYGHRTVVQIIVKVNTGI